MDVSKYKEVLGKLSFLRDYSALLVPVVVGLAAVVFLILSPLMSGKLAERITNKSVTMGKKVRSLSNDAVSLNQWKVAQQYQQSYERDANQIRLLTRQCTQRQLLSYKIFPEPKDTSILIFEEFGRRYRDALEKLTARVNALDCPTDIELDRSLNRLSAGSRRSSRGSGVRMMMQSIGVSTKTGSLETKITDILCREKAESACVYANATELIGYRFWNEYKYTGMKEDIENCWYWQLACWIIEDVIDTIGSLNAGSDSVFTSPVKRLLNVSFTTDESEIIKRQAAGKRCRYVRSTDEELTVSCTSRLCDDDIDVVHFNVAVVTSARAVPPFMKQLCSAKQHKFNGYLGQDDKQIFEHNQITILEYDIASIDRQDYDHRLYRYGEDAVVKLSLVCEYLFNKSGYDAIKPESVKESLKQSARTRR